MFINYRSFVFKKMKIIRKFKFMYYIFLNEVSREIDFLFLYLCNIEYILNYIVVDMEN